MKIDPTTLALVAALATLVPSLVSTVVGFFIRKWIDSLERAIDRMSSKAEAQDKQIDDLGTRLTRIEERVNQLDRRRPTRGP